MHMMCGDMVRVVLLGSRGVDWGGRKGGVMDWSGGVVLVSDGSCRCDCILAVR